MAENKNQSVDSHFNVIRVGHLPSGVTAKEITRYFEPFGVIQNLYLKRRVSKNSLVYLKNPYVILVFEESESVNRIMAARPFTMGECLLFIRRCLPITSRYPCEAFLSVKKLLIRTISEKNDEILPDDKSIVDYLSISGGKIEYFERLNNNTALVQFDDYDPVDICCLLRPHFINNQPVEIEKCSDEDEVRRHLDFQQKSHSISSEFSSISNSDNQIMNTVSPTPILSIDDEIEKLRSSFNDETSRHERKHEQLIALLSNEWKQTAKERIRLQRLTLDYKQEFERLTIENRKWQKLYSDSLKEKPIVQTEGERNLQEICDKYNQ